MNTTITTASVKNSVNNNKIQDFGQKIGGARKDWFANMKEAAQKFAEVGAVELIAAPLSKVVALPNLEKMTEAGALSADSARALTLYSAGRRIPPPLPPSCVKHKRPTNALRSVQTWSSIATPRQRTERPQSAAKIPRRATAQKSTPRQHQRTACNSWRSPGV